MRDIKVDSRTQMHARPEEKQAADGVPSEGMREGGKDIGQRNGVRMETGQGWRERRMQQCSHAQSGQKGEECAGEVEGDEGKRRGPETEQEERCARG